MKQFKLKKIASVMMLSIALTAGVPQQQAYADIPGWIKLIIRDIPADIIDIIIALVENTAKSWVKDNVMAVYNDLKQIDFAQLIEDPESELAELGDKIFDDVKGNSLKAINKLEMGLAATPNQVAGMVSSSFDTMMKSDYLYPTINRIDATIDDYAGQIKLIYASSVDEQLKTLLMDEDGNQAIAGPYAKKVHSEAIRTAKRMLEHQDQVSLPMLQLAATMIQQNPQEASEAIQQMAMDALSSSTPSGDSELDTANATQSTMQLQQLALSHAALQLQATNATNQMLANQLTDKANTEIRAAADFNDRAARKSGYYDSIQKDLESSGCVLTDENLPLDCSGYTDPMVRKSRLAPGVDTSGLIEVCEPQGIGLE